VTLPELFPGAGYLTTRMGKIFHAAGVFDDRKAWDSTTIRTIQASTTIAAMIPDAAPCANGWHGCFAHSRGYSS